MTIKSKLTEKDFINVNFVLLYRKLAIKVITVIMAVTVFVTLVTVVMTKTVPITQILFPVLFMILLPIITYFSAKKNFKTDKRISEEIEYRFEKEMLSIKGESFSSELSWNKIYKVLQTKNWILIFQNSQMANVIPKWEIWEGDVTALKDILIENNVRNNL